MARKQEREERATALEDLDVLEVSLVKRGANQKRFALWKTEENDTMRDLTAAILAAPGEEIPELVKEMVVKGLSKEARSTVADAVKLLSAVKEELSSDLYKQIQSALGLKGMDEEKGEEDAEEKPPELEAEAEEEQGDAEPPAGDVADQEKAEDEDEEAEKSVAKSEDPRVVQLMKQAEELQAELNSHKAEKRTKAFITKAQEELSAVPGADPEAVGNLLRDLDDADPALAARVEAVFKAADAFCKNSGVLGELGSSQAGAAIGADGSDFNAKMDGLARQRVAKTGESYAQAYEKVLGENASLYSQSIGWTGKES